MELCHECLAVFKRLFQPPDDPTTREFTTISEFKDWEAWKADTERKRCPFCSLIIYCFDELGYHVVSDCAHANVRSGSIKVLPTFIPAGSSYPRPGQYKGLASICITVEKTCCPGHGLLAYLDVWADPDTPAFLTNHLKHSARLPTNASPAQLAQINHWLSTCLATHPPCRTTLSGTPIDESTPPPLPTRVIDVSSDPLKLIHTTPTTPGAQFAALSHCWGPPTLKPLQTTRATLADRLQAIPLHALPKTFRDAIVVTRTLGMRYLWIDSLCIVQDDAADWAAEAPRMATVYQGARVTLAGASAENSSQGLFLVEREEGDPVVELPFYPDGKSAANGQFKAARGTRARLEPDFTPLGRRAWVVQERQLSRRMVYFTRDGVFWACRGLPGGQTMDERGFPAGEGAGPSWREWGDVVVQYCGCDMTRESDRVVALEGMAGELRKVRAGERYVWGTWEGEIPGTLTWVGKGGLRRNEDLGRVPSWSWLGWVGEREFVFLRRSHRGVCESVAVDEGDGVVVESGLSGLVRTPQPACTTSPPSWAPFLWNMPAYEIVARVGDIERSVGYATFDMQPEETFFCLFLTTYLIYSADVGRPTHDGYTVLLVTKAESGDYQRIGVGVVDCAEWYPGIRKQKVRLC